ncbi:hypothetical protein WJX72_005566 [[Myrmecia] bisecta]|uniref:Uncharacterized protein n=1 Tax=[Myrmecia] bisecta TaxID=41462 RepID=A0AAW1PER5_9CHLO
MGLAMANNLIKAGYDLTVWNRSSDKCQPLVEAGAQAAASPKEVAEQCDIVLAMLADPAAALEVATGEAGIAAGMAQGKGYVDVSTVDAATAQEISRAIKSAGGEYLEAPVSGSKGPAEQGTLIFLTGGDRSLFDRAAPLLDVMGKRSFFLREVGNGAKMKLVVNMVMGNMMAAFAEGLTLAEKAGLSKQDVIDVVGLGAIAAPMFALKGPAMAQRKYATAFPLKHQQKDLRLALELGQEVQQPLPVAAAANELYLQAQSAGHGDADFSAVLEAVLQQ